MSTIRLNAIHKSFGATDVIKDVSIDVDHGEFVVFVGPSGCGKSTLLRLIAGLEDISEGTLEIGGRLVNDISPRDRGIAMVFQSYALYPHMTVYQNMAYGLKVGKISKVEIRQKVEDAAKVLDLAHLLDRRPSQLSGGQRQRVAIGRAIVREPDVFLFDEPLSNLDAALRVQTRMEIARLHQDLKTTIIYVTHDQVEAMTLADKIVVLQDGCVEQIGAPLELYNRPQNLFVAGFIGSPNMNFIPARIDSATQTHVTLDYGADNAVTIARPGCQALAGQSVTLGIRPEHVSDGAAGNMMLAATITVAEHMGNVTNLYCALTNGNAITITLPGTCEHTAGNFAHFTAAEQHIHVFNQNGIAILPDA